MTPILGGFTAGVTVEIFRADNGSKIADGSTDNSGKAVITYSSIYDGVLVIKLTGSSLSKYYDERTDSLQPFGSEKYLLVLVPASIATKSSVVIAATVLTTAISICAGFDSSGVAGVSFPALGTSDASIQAAMVKVMSALGFDPSKIDPLATPSYLSAKDMGLGAKLQGDALAVTHGAALLAIAKITPAGTDMATFSQTIAISIKNDTLKQTVPAIAALPAVFRDVVSTMVAVASQGNVSMVPSPGWGLWDSGLFEQTNWL